MHEGVQHGEQHPDVVHLDVGRGRQGHGYSDEAETMIQSFKLELFLDATL